MASAVPVIIDFMAETEPNQTTMFEGATSIVRTAKYARYVIAWLNLKRESTNPILGVALKADPGHRDSGIGREYRHIFLFSQCLCLVSDEEVVCSRQINVFGWTVCPK